MSNSYEIHNKYIKSIEFNVLILEIPKEEVEEKLAYLAREKGRISRYLYEDFIIATCVANLNELTYTLGEQKLEQDQVSEIRDIVVNSVIEHNKNLNPSNLILNKNYVIKIKNPKIKLGEDEKPLNKNNQWDAPLFVEPDDEVCEECMKDNKRKLNDVDIKDIKELDYEVVKKWWTRLGQYISIKRFNEADIHSIFKSKFFHNRSSFNTFIVSICILDFEDLISQLDTMGIPKRVAPPLLMHELYELCRQCNMFLTYDNSKEFSDKDYEDEDDEDCSCETKRSASTGTSMNKYSKGNKNKPKKKFRDVPEEDLLNLGDKMKMFIIGQDNAVDSLSNAVQRASVGLKDPNRPIGSFLFAGKTGCGKTLSSKVLADELIKSRKNLITIDCSEYSSDHEYAKLIGSPNGYIGHESGGRLTNAVMKNPFSVVVFDEIEKASKRVYDLLLQILEEGRLTDGKGKTVSFKDCIIILTSNIGVSEINSVKKRIGFGDVAVLTDERKNKALDDALKKKFKPEFLNRIDEVVHFNSLDKKDYLRIIDIELYKLNDNLKNSGTKYSKFVNVNFGKKTTDYIYKHGIDEDFGARPLKRCIETDVSTPLAKALLLRKVEGPVNVRVDVKKDKIEFSIRNKKTKSTKCKKTKTESKCNCGGADD